MRTDDFIAFLSRDAVAVTSESGVRRFTIAVGIGALGAALLTLAMLGVNPVLAHYVTLPYFWLKGVFVALLVSTSLVAVQRLSRPGDCLGSTPVLLTMSILAMWAVGGTVLWLSPDDQRASAFFGRTWAVCPLLVAMLSAPTFVGAVWAMRGLAPTRLRLTGAAIGFLSGAIGALAYCLHCPELAPPFVGFWYLLGILIPTGMGTLLGNRLFQW